MKLGSSKLRTGYDAKSWPVLLLLLVVVLLPTVGVLWFMSQAMRNEQLAVRQKLSDVYEAQLLGLQQELQLYWQSRTAQLDVKDPEAYGSRIFAEKVRTGLADSIITYDRGGHPTYPAPALAPAASGDARELPKRGWLQAKRLEHSGQSEAAAALYRVIAERSTDPDWTARAFQAQARCLVQAGQPEVAVSILTLELGHPDYHQALDSQGRLIAPSAKLRALQLIGKTGEVEDPSFGRIATALQARLNDYDDPAFPSAQRRFLMKALAELLSAGSKSTVSSDTSEPSSVFDMLPAEELAARYLESDPPSAPTISLRPSGLPGVWHLAFPLASSRGTLVALFEQQRLIQDLESLIAGQRLPENTTVELLSPGEQPAESFLVSLPVGGFLQDWQLVLQPEDQTLFATAASQRVQAYLLTGVLGVVLILTLTLLVARFIERQLRLTRLKNDLLSTVSHELKTPLASMRLLVDTLLETGVQDTQRANEYLQLIASENARLSRLVDNFLTFSRIEQGRQSFEREPIQAAAVAEAAASSVADRFNALGCRFEMDLPDHLPPLIGDHDALVTVLINLLDNAYKYSDEEKHIVLSSSFKEGSICFAVQDRGIGMSNRDARRIFDRFYQVDQSLSRPESGCGLGLSIVKLIVSAHGGTVDVDSQPGEGSTFTVRLPAVLNEEKTLKESS